MSTVDSHKCSYITLNNNYFNIIPLSSLLQPVFGIAHKLILEPVACLSLYSKGVHKHWKGAWLEYFHRVLDEHPYCTLKQSVIGSAVSADQADHGSAVEATLAVGSAV